MSNHIVEPRFSAKILLAEDEPFLAEGIKENLEAEGYLVDWAMDGAQALNKALTGKYDLILMDVMMPHLDGLQVCENIRGSGLQTPILFLTVKAAQEDRIRGLEAGGDDYLAKPFNLKELLLRVAAILRRSLWYKENDNILNFSGNQIEFDTHRAVSWHGEIQTLSHKEALILKLLSEHESEVVSREQILDRVWGYDNFPTTRTIDNFIARLRKRFERDPEMPRHFHTVRGVGYRFTRQTLDPTVDGPSHTTQEVRPK